MTRVRQRIDPEILNSAASVIRCLGHPLRLRLLEALESGERSVSELQVLSEAPQATVSEQLGVLRGQNIVGARREGPFVYYRILEPKVSRILACIRGCETPPGRRNP
ncbi:MAG TPA: metalloregulator ArsR/SmtB family transcription factor [Gemmatimonadales bacterium]